MTARVDALVLHAADIAATCAFYRAIGVALAEESHGDGPVHYACELGPVHFALYPAAAAGRGAPRGTAGSAQLGFQVASVDAAVAQLRAAGVAVLVEPEDVPWGRRAVVQDPDGRPVELNRA